MKKTTINLEDNDYFEIKKRGLSYISLIRLGLSHINGLTSENDRLSIIEERLKSIEEKVSRFDGRHNLLMDKIVQIEGEVNKDEHNT
jgi:hypothetical protein